MTSQFVISGGDGPIMLESGKRVLHQMSELVQRPVESLVALDRIFLSGNNNAHSECFSLVTYYLAVVASIRYLRHCAGVLSHSGHQ